MAFSALHQPVLCREAVAALAVRPDGRYVDATFGRGGHAAAILGALGADGRLLALDRDPQAEAWARQRFAGEPRLTFVRSPFSRLAAVVEGCGWSGRVDGVLLDLGVSSPQLDDPARGFSFAAEGPLDMRMDPDSGVSAAQWLAQAGEEEIDRVLKEFGEERFHRRVARAIVGARRRRPIASTAELARIVAAAVPVRERGRHPATRSFQAVRIFINRELEELAAVLEQAPAVLGAGGRLVVISFHSLEDRMVKRFMRDRARGLQGPPGLPLPAAHSAPSLRLIGRAVQPGDAETAVNPRARSARLRIAERLP